jgi:hypothetical protein
MRKALFTLLALAPILIHPHSVHADTVTFLVSVVGSGSIGGDTFTDQRVTLTASAPEEVFAEAFIEAPSPATPLPLSLETTAMPKNIRRAHRSLIPTLAT